jgi:tRNA pseudouridine13 synthase
MSERLSHAIPSCGGVFKESPEDFEVEEVPAYLPSGAGEHLFLWVEKRGLTTVDLSRTLARHCGAKEDVVSWAGLKDKQALTRQWLCLPAKYEGEVASFSHPEARVLEVKRHTNKLKNGHLKGNRFRVRLNSVTDAQAARASFEVLTRQGLPNYYGQQRFGTAGRNVEMGRKILVDSMRCAPFEKKLFLSALQSSLFNQLLDARLREGTLGKALKGDVLKKHATGGEFVCAEPEVDQPRVEAFEVSPAGPMYGPEMTMAADGVREAEDAVLKAARLEWAQWEKGGKLTLGARRHYRVMLEDAAFATPAEGVVELSFGLPSGSYASVVVDELLKKGAATAPG